MANNKIIVSSGNGTYQETTSSFSIDNDNGIISASSAVVATSSLPTNVSGVLQVYKGKVIPLWLTSSIWDNFDNDNNQLTTWDGDFSKANLSGTLFQYRNDLPITTDGKDYNGIGPHRVASASFNGDIIGTVSQSVPVKIISVANVTGGILDSRFGGTGTSSFEDGAIVTLSGSGFKPSDGANNIIATDVNGNWSLLNKTSIEPTDTYLTSTLVYLYTGSDDQLGGTYNWQKPSGGRCVRGICQGGGGGGGGGTGTTSATNAGGGGGGGGYSDVIFSGQNIPNNTNILITVGSGGLGGSATQSGRAGSNSSFGDYCISYGGSGGGGASGAGNTGIGGSGGGGYLVNGGNGGTEDLPANIESINKYFGAPGGGAGQTSTNPATTPGGSTLLVAGGLGGARSTVTTTNAGDGQNSNVLNYFNFKNYFLNGYILDNFINNTLPPLASSGAGGGGYYSPSTVNASYRAGDGGNGKFGAGAGGGGAAKNGALRAGFGGNGGSGYVLIICT